MPNLIVDPYRQCADACSHDLAPGVLVTELLDADGPHHPLHLIPFLGATAAEVRPAVRRPRGYPPAA